MPFCRSFLCVSIFAGSAVTAFADGDVSSAEREFARSVWPVLQAKCAACHFAPERKGELDLSSRAALLRGGESGRPAIVPGNASASPLYQAVTWVSPDLRMPPKENDRLAIADVVAVRAWIDAGAPWPSEERLAELRREIELEDNSRVRWRTSGGLASEWTDRRYRAEDLWAYHPVAKPEVPDEPGAHHPVDAFVARRLRASEIEPAPRADRRALIRRVTWNLLGLPPTPAEVEAFVTDSAPDREAFARVVDRLLASPHYGEQAARRWLDVTRYADTAGFANDYERPNAWRYRDYVVRAFNEDKPYDRFVREQIAGDEIDPSNPELLVATGFLRMGPWEQTGMSVAKVTRQQFLDDVTESVGQVFLSQTLQCARCHDHKFDPIPTRDYYGIQAVFATTQFAERPAPFLASENRARFESERGYLEKRIARYEEQQREIRAKSARAEKEWYKERGREFAPRAELRRRGVPEDEIAPRHVGLDTKDFGLERISRKNLTRHRWELDRFRPLALAVYNGGTRSFNNVSSRLSMPDKPLDEGTIETTSILGGGDLFRPGEPVEPGILSAASHAANSPTPAAAPFAIPTSPDGRRLAWAMWLTDPSHPLTARSIVNRVWQWSFGRGLAPNANNFGAMGQKPSHPELLDWLAAKFVEEGWSIKRLQRLILTSDAYCRSSIAPQETTLTSEARSAGESAYALFASRRLSAEELCDAMIAASGELNREIGGIPVRPDIHLEVALQPRQIMGTYAPAYQPSPTPAERNRRRVYAMRIRGLRDPLLSVFNQPTPRTSCEQRETSTVTPQVFALFNSRYVHSRALAFAARVRREANADEDAVRRSFALALGRAPSEDELGESMAHWIAMTEIHESAPAGRKPASEGVPTEVVREAVEEMNGEPFTYRERLEVYDDYVPDLQPGDVDPKTRALAELCLVLFNSSEFLYVP